MELTTNSIAQFFAVGINYKKTDAAKRARFAILPESYIRMTQKISEYNVREMFVLSTCNRSEIYGFASSATHLINLFCTETTGSRGEFLEAAYIKQGKDAIQHLFEVGAGLDSQILGDYEIVGQIRQAVKIAKEQKSIGTFIQRMVNGVLQSSKEVKNKTELSGGTVSVSFAAVQYVRQHISHPEQKNILLLGTGKIGRNTAKNLVDYLNNRNITLINRSPEKAKHLAAELNLKHGLMEDLDQAVADADIIFTATNSPVPVLGTAQLSNTNEKLIIDLAVPGNVDAEAMLLPGITVVNVDELTKIKDDTLQHRIDEIPHAQAIIAQYLGEYVSWLEDRQHVPVLNAVKSTLEQMHSSTESVGMLRDIHLAEKADPKKIQKIITSMAVRMRTSNERGCCFIQAINEYIAV